MKKIMRLFIVMMLAGCCLITAQDTFAAKEQKEKTAITITTENGVKLVCDTANKEHYYVKNIKNPQSKIVIPETVDGVHPIYEFRGDKVKTDCSVVKEIHFSKNMKNIHSEYNWGSDKVYYDIITFEKFPNLEKVVFDEKNDNYYVEEGKIYFVQDKKDRIVATVPKYSGQIFLKANDTDFNLSLLRNLENVTSFQVDSNNKKYKSEEGVLYNKKGTKLLCYPIKKRKEEFVIPQGIKMIEKYACAGAVYLKRVVLPDSMRTIGEGAFYNSALEKILFNKNCEEMQSKALYKTNIKSIQLPSGMCSAEIGSIPVKKLVLPKRLFEIDFAEDEKGNRMFFAKVLVIKNHNLSIDSYTYGEDRFSKNGIFWNKKFYVKKDSWAEYELNDWKDYSKFKMYLLPGKIKDSPDFSKKIDTSWYNKKKKIFYISTQAQLAGLSKLSQKESFPSKNKKFILKKNIDMKAYKNFAPIDYFEGTFDGNGKTIKNLNIDLVWYTTVGLFGEVLDDGVVKNVKVRGKIKGGDYTGGIVGRIRKGAKVRNCSFKGKISGYGYVNKLYNDKGWRWW